jgi:hypothetical protein
MRATAGSVIVAVVDTDITHVESLAARCLGAPSRPCTSPTLGGGEKGRLARRTPVSTGASADGCHPSHSQATNANVVPKLKRSTK